jgi:hypothetical protein
VTDLRDRAVKEHEVRAQRQAEAAARRARGVLPGVLGPAPTTGRLQGFAHNVRASVAKATAAMPEMDALVVLEPHPSVMRGDGPDRTGGAGRPAVWRARSDQALRGAALGPRPPRKGPGPRGPPARVASMRRLPSVQRGRRGGPLPVRALRLPRSPRRRRPGGAHQSPRMRRLGTEGADVGARGLRARAARAARSMGAPRTLPLPSCDLFSFHRLFF